jgi:hypothetical protein
MVARFPTAIALAPLVMLSFPAYELRLLSAGICAVAAVMLATLVAREMVKDQRILILGAGAMASQLIEEIEAARPRRYIVAGVVDDTQPPPGSAVSARWLGRCDRLGEIVAQVQPARIVVAIADRRERLPLESLLESRVRGVVVEDALDFYEQLTGKIAIEALRPSMLFLSKGFRNHGAAQATARVVSVMVAAIGLVLLLPLLVAIAVAVKLDSRGPVFFIIRTGEVPDDAPVRRAAVGMGARQRHAHHAPRPLPAALPAR